jgi:hypothetical protein
MVRAFIEAHGTTRFQALRTPGRFQPAGDSSEKVYDRVGLRSDTDDGTEYLFFTESFSKEVCHGSSTTAVLQALKDKGLLRHEPKRMTVRLRLPGTEQQVRVYAISARILEDGGTVDGEED